jgi:hypothetical protein
MKLLKLFGLCFVFVLCLKINGINVLAYDVRFIGNVEYYNQDNNKICCEQLDPSKLNEDCFSPITSKIAKKTMIDIQEKIKKEIAHFFNDSKIQEILLLVAVDIKIDGDECYVMSKLGNCSYITFNDGKKFYHPKLREQKLETVFYRSKVEDDCLKIGVIMRRKNSI